jgi:hypothetical protein
MSLKFERKLIFLNNSSKQASSQLGKEIFYQETVQKALNSYLIEQIAKENVNFKDNSNLKS